ncbi:hypothetical protein PT250_02495 [Erysipelothrix rhusiopathiae]|uniref:hypothetical protein n=1 Tax=Erysipelothrix rhusiopathiae TaxID=1648 RepID=UPI000E1C080F|nr:hypothetical protein [Erysipelothrix rhusiopathiae]MDE8275933.1 hypothetical protein [Erysipelothrix rhusiopathiae]MDE8340979.1 hypothetical protein [Erysipelothrix rhusiopathiae]
MAKLKINTNKIMNKIQAAATDELHKRLYDVKCPNCGAQVEVPTGISSCPECSNKIDLDLDISFK